ncbi:MULTISPECIES: GntR family transcriptional regulator [Cupriavidus]|uniref:GntR family transcriptional regulator n=1 Tax=Cupriavidus basilensis TaxID=68895 RepID=A0A643FNU0_9BURK|nr:MULTISPECIES: GntR family transcriptional regulator [Cupriavidus]MBB1630248.1 GntR family transcriptional regulator [Cupriavidus sp. UME77]MCP3023242.1 GntR family transcriptional regulator [Cupriavidus basilensis]MDR3383969.1 GntR family transcriptional regulator [Cupriavidus basilensis]NUA27508.1 GntR family transcriptional regulator [Cupriavidus basilensis]QOT77894.1 GntR family transcriptional regulator [Cupriavidus basilensis]
MSNPIRLVGGADHTPEPASRAATGAALREQAYAEIKRRIISCEFRPGEPLNEAQVAALLGIGRTPVHQALHRLEVEGLVSILPRKGVLVSPLSLNEVLDMIEVRATNEVLCATLACERAHESDLKAMREIVDRSPDLIARRDITGLAALDLKFHTAMSAASRNRVLADLLRGLHEKQARFWFLSLSDPQHLENVYQEHRVIIDALERRDVPAVREAIREHIDEFRKNIIRTI